MTSGSEIIGPRAGDSEADSHSGDSVANFHSSDPVAESRVGDPVAESRVGDPVAESRVGDPVADSGAGGAVADPLEGDERLPDFFGDAWTAVHGFAVLLRTLGVERGMLGPNEPVRLWERHLLNCAGAVLLLPTSGTLVDLGSGGGLPGIVLGAMRPEAHVILLEPMARRTSWLQLVVDELSLGNVEVVRGRAEDVAGAVVADAVTARAVSSLDNLLRWAAPLVRTGGGLYAIKGSRAADEAAASAAAARKEGWSQPRVREAATLPGVEVTRVVAFERVGGASRVR